MSGRYPAPRRATADDVDVLARHRVRMFADMGFESADGFRALTDACRAWFIDALARERYLGWLVTSPTAPNEVVAGSGLLLLEWPPGVRDTATTRGYILNVYTEPEHRGHGLATILTQAALDESRSRGIRVVTLHASDEGRAIYERLGFEENNEMLILLKDT